MYLPAHFQETRREALHALIASHPLGTLVTLGSDGLTANNIPFELDPEAGPHGTLRAHVARANPVWKNFSTEIDALVIFQGPQAYITPTWYEATKPTDGKVVPTWNYCTVHAHGPLQIFDDREWLRGQVTRLVNRHEGTRAEPWAVSDAPGDFIEKQLGAIVGIEIPLTRLVGKWKVSQNRGDGDRVGIVRGLENEPGSEAKAMAALVAAKGAVCPMGFGKGPGA